MSLQGLPVSTTHIRRPNRELCEMRRMHRVRRLHIASAALIMECRRQREIKLRYMRDGLPGVLHLLDDAVLDLLRVGAEHEGDERIHEMVCAEIKRREGVRT